MDFLADKHRFGLFRYLFIYFYVFNLFKSTTHFLIVCDFVLLFFPKWFYLNWHFLIILCDFFIYQVYLLYVYRHADFPPHHVLMYLRRCVFIGQENVCGIYR